MLRVLRRKQTKQVSNPPTESIRAKLGLPPQMDVGPYAYGYHQT